MKKLILYTVIFILFSLSSNTMALGINKTYPLDIIIFYDTKLIPFIKDKFKENISDINLQVKRKLIKTKLNRYEIIDGNTTIIVHIEYVVAITSISDDFTHTTIRGQEILFIKNKNTIQDYYPFTEYLIESNINEIEKLLAKEVLWQIIF